MTIDELREIKLLHPQQLVYYKLGGTWYTAQLKDMDVIHRVSSNGSDEVVIDSRDGTVFNASRLCIDGSVVAMDRLTTGASVRNLKDSMLNGYSFDSNGELYVGADR